MVNNTRKDGGMHTLMVSLIISSTRFKSQSNELDKWIARQMEIHPDKDAVLLVAGRLTREEIESVFEKCI